MSQSGTDGRPARFDVRAAAAAAIVFGALSGGAETQQGGKPSGDGLSREALDDRPSSTVHIPAPTRTKAAPVAKPDEKPTPAAPKTEAAPPAPKVEATPPAPEAKAAEGAAPAPKPAAAPGPGLFSPEEAQALRTEVDARLKALAPASEGGEAKADADPSAKLASKALGDVLEDRRRRLDDYDKLTKDLAGLASPENDPERKLAEANAELADLQRRSEQPVEALMPTIFAQDGPIDQAGRTQMKEAIEGIAKDVKAYQDKLESTPAVAEKEAKGPLADLKAERDRIAQGIAAIKARADGKDAAAPPRSAADRKLAEEKAVNLRVEAAVENLRLQIVEKKIARTAKQVEIAAADRKRWIARVKIGNKTLEPMQKRFQRLSDEDEKDLQRKAKAEQSKASIAQDAIERYRAERLGELLDLEAQVVRAEQAAVVAMEPSLVDMTTQANIAQANFQRIKVLVEESNLSRVDVLSINADYRRIDPERKRIRREERDAVDKRLRDYTNMLAGVELNQIEDRLLDQIDLDDLLDKLPVARHEAATGVWRDLEDKHSALLERRRTALKNLVGDQQEVLDAIDRRLATLDDESSFIRTHLFWVRDQDPISLSTMTVAAGELRRLTRASIGLAGEAITPTGWKRTAPEFLAASAVILALPLGIVRARRALKRRLAQCLPAPEAATGGELKVDMKPVVHQG
ncbi:coiled-coil domain-containing protein [Paludisphaera rhizosphaerae]|uniref:hypothetical protein n=1 Tax=Paludisphaera rhizosphaerae TaxID=2711216 RepID=UPI0013EA058D|nr:hypothetical protein [Paludisphaera rhizosphaerae]